MHIFTYGVQISNKILILEQFGFNFLFGYPNYTVTPPPPNNTLHQQQIISNSVLSLTRSEGDYNFEIILKTKPVIHDRDIFIIFIYYRPIYIREKIVFNCRETFLVLILL